MYSSIFQGVLALSSLLGLAQASPIVGRDITKANAEAAYSQLMTWYNHDNGLWIPSTGWWNSANCLTVIAHLAAVDSNLKSKITSVMSETYTKAQQYNMQMAKVQGTSEQPFLPETYYGHHWPEFPPWIQNRPMIQSTGGFLNEYVYLQMKYGLY